MHLGKKGSYTYQDGHWKEDNLQPPHVAAFPHEAIPNSPWGKPSKLWKKLGCGQKGRVYGPIWHWEPSQFQNLPQTYTTTLTSQTYQVACPHFITHH